MFDAAHIKKKFKQYEYENSVLLPKISLHTIHREENIIKGKFEGFFCLK